MEYLTLENIKKHCRIDINDDDTMLELYGSSAEYTVAQYLNRGKTVSEMVSSLTEEYGEIPTPIIHATLLLVDISYQHHSPASPHNMYYVLYGFDSRIKPFMIL